MVYRIYTVGTSTIAGLALQDCLNQVDECIVTINNSKKHGLLWYKTLVGVNIYIKL